MTAIKADWRDIGQTGGVPVPGDSQIDAADYNLHAAQTNTNTAALSGKVDQNTVVINVRDYGAVGDGTTDDTTAIEAAAAASVAASGALAIYLPVGDYVYNGSGLNAANYAGHGQVIIIKGAGEFATTITLGASSYFLQPTTELTHFVMEDLFFQGGKGAVKHTYTGTCTNGTFHVNRVRFMNYTECAAASDSSDMPFWFFDECWWAAANSTSTIGVAPSAGLTDVITFSKCHFQRNRVHVKAHSGGNNVHFENCDFIRQDTTNSGGPRIDIWVVPSASSNNGGSGLTCRSIKFGAEDLLSSDYRIVYADEGSGGTNGVRMPNLGADSTGFIIGHTIAESFFQVNSDYFVTGAAGPSMIYSTTPNVYDLAMPNNHLLGRINYMLEYRTPPTAADANNSRNTFGPLYGLTDTNHSGPSTSNDPGAGYVNDPAQILGTRSTVARQNGSGSSASYVQCLSTAAAAFTAANGTVTAATDAYGGSDAATINVTGDFGGAYASISNLIVGLPCWVEIDVKQPASSPLSGVRVSIHNLTGNLEHWARQLEIPAAALGWVTYAFCFTPRSTGSGLNPALLIGAPVGTGATDSTARGQVLVGRPRVYQANERQIGAAILRDNSFTLQKSGDPTKQAKFDLSALTASRTITLSDSDLVIGTPKEVRPAPALYDSFTAADGTALDSTKWTVTTGGAATAAATTNSNRARYTSGATGGYASADRVFVVSTLATSLADAELLFRHTWGNVGIESYMLFALRATNSDPQTGSNYEVMLANTVFEVAKFVSGSRTLLSGANVPYTDVGLAAPTTGGVKWVRFRVKGTTVAMKIWDDGTPEPAAWAYSFSDSSVTAGGKVATSISGGNAAASGVNYVDQFHIYAL